MTTGLESLREGGPHRRYLYGYLSQLKEDNPDWIVTVVGAEDGNQYIWLRTGRRGAPGLCTPLLMGRESLTANVIRRFVEKHA